MVYSGTTLGCQYCPAQNEGRLLTRDRMGIYPILRSHHQSAITASRLSTKIGDILI